MSTGRVCAQPGTDSTKSGFEKSHSPPTAGVNGSGGSNFNGWRAGQSVSGFWENEDKTARKLEIQRKSHRNLWDLAKSSGNLIEFDEILPDPVKISPNLHDISRESGFFFCWILEFYSPGSGFFSGRFGF